MNYIFGPHNRKFVLVFRDDVLVFSATLEDHIEHLQTVFQILRENQFYVKASKCSFAQQSMEYLGHIISDQGVATDPEKISVVQQWSIPSNITELRSFLGLAGYYRRFIRNYGMICRPLHDLLKRPILVDTGA